MESKLHPLVLWAQRKDRILVTVALQDCKDPQINLDESKLTFSSRGGVEQNEYEVELEFYEQVVPEESKQHVSSRQVCFDIKRKVEGPYWPRLLKTTAKPHYLKTDFNRWKDEDDSDVDEVPEEANFEDMVSKMGGAGLGGGGGERFDPGDADDSDDSDDEALPDLEG